MLSNLYEALNLTQSASFTCEVNIDKFFTGNMMYDFRTKKGTSKVWVQLDENVRVMKESITKQLSTINLKSLTSLQGVVAYEITATFFYNKWLTGTKNLRKIDLTNVWKPIEDAIMDALGLDDSLATKVTLIKELKPESEDSNVNIRIELKFLR